MARRTNQYGIFVQSAPKRKYGFWKFMGDCFMTLLTQGLWLVWIFVREMRHRNG